MFMHFIRLDKQTIDFLFKGQEDSYAYFNPNLYGGGANLPPRQFFATAQKRLTLDC